jgi:osmoprotectant transport system substrate-binding protein
MRKFRSAAIGAATLALLVSACSPGDGGSSSAPSGSAPAPSGGASIASQLVLGGPPECPERPFCLQGLEGTYGLEFKEFSPLDAGGPLTVEALKSGNIQVGLLFTSDPAIAVNDFVLLEDDKQLQLADNLVPVVRSEILDDMRDAADLLDAVMAELSQDALTALNRAVVVDQETAAGAAEAWLTEIGLLPGAGGSGKGEITVGSTNFYEQEILGEVFAQVLEANGYDVERKFQLGNREIVFPALESGEIDVLAEYAATAAVFVTKDPASASTDPAATVEALDAARPDYVLILPWNLRKEIAAQMSHIGQWGGKFVVPIPEATVFDPESAQ